MNDAHCTTGRISAPNGKFVIGRTIAAGLLIATAGLATAQDFPSKAIRLVVGFPPGGSNDIVARALGPRITAAFNQQVIIDNRPGANGIIAAEYVAKSPADGYTVILTGVSTFVLNPLVYAKVPYDTQKDLAAISTVAVMPQIIVANPALPVKNLKDLVALANRRPGELTGASPGVGGLSHLTLEMFKSMAKANIEHVAYKGTAPALVDIVGGHVPLLVADLPAPLPHVKSGKLKALAVTGEKRTPQLPEVMTAVEQGFPDLKATNWLGVMAAARTPAPVIERLHKAIVAAVEAPDVKDRYTAIGVDALTSPNPAHFSSFVKDEFVRWEKVVRQAKVQLTN
jgi:tripartite-type tricarboxylate transporter receptor subunit TctC